MEEKKNNVEIDGKTKRRKAKIAVISLCTILALFLGLQVYASVNGYGNVFFMIRDLVTTKNASEEEEIFIEGTDEKNDVNTVKQDDNSKDTVKQLDINSSQVSKLYNYIPVQDVNSPELANAYQNSKITMEDMDEKCLLVYAFRQLSLSDADKLPYQNEDGTTEEANEGWFGFKAELLQDKVKEIYGKNIENQDFDYGVQSCRYTNGMYFHSAGGELSEMIFNVRTIDKSYEDDKKIYIEDNYLALKENTEENSYKLYTSSNCTKLVETLEDSLAEKLGYGVPEKMLKEISKKYESKMVRYKHTFKKNADGTYYWYSTEPIETGNDDTESSSISQYNAPQLKTNVKDIEEAAIKKLKISSLDGKTYSIGSDINKDGKEDVIKIKNKGYNGATLSYNDKVFYNEYTMHAVSDVYIADLDESDNKLDLIVYADVASEDYAYNIFAFNGNNFEFRRNSQDVIGNNMYIDGKGNVIVPIIDSKPIISNKYYSYKQDKYINLSVDLVKDTLITFQNVYFTEDLSNIEKTIENMSIGFDKALEKANIEEVSNIKAYVLEFNNEFGDEIKVKLEDGRTGYLFTGHFSG